jgi:predicted aldo/keto reductase-like oxidoreductase
MATALSIQNVLRQLGKNGAQIPAAGLGLANLAGAYGNAPSKEESFAFLDRALEIGNVFWDTAECVHLISDLSFLTEVVSTASMTSCSQSGSLAPGHGRRSF